MSGSTAVSACKNANNLFNHFVDHLSTSDGVKDALKVIDISSQWASKFSLAPSLKTSLSQISDFTSKASNLISSFGLIKQTSELVFDLSLAGRVAFSKHDLTTDKVKNVYAQAARGMLDYSNSVTDCINNLHYAGCVNLGSGHTASQGVFYFTDLVGNSIDLISNAQDISNRSSEISNNSVSEKKGLRYKLLNHLSMMKIFTNATCLIGSVLGVVALLTGGSIVFPIVGLVLSTAWILSKMTTHFYEKMFIK
jgi:hypothetical protein